MEDAKIDKSPNNDEVVWTVEKPFSLDDATRASAKRRLRNMQENCLAIRRKVLITVVEAFGRLICPHSYWSELRGCINCGKEDVS